MPLVQTPLVLVGRERECARIDRLLEDAREGRSGALVARGEAGAGKSALLEYAIVSAADARVVRTLGVETETQFTFAGLHELVHPLLDCLDELVPVQADALRGALALAEPQGVGRLYIGAATLSLLAAARGERLLLCVVDDAQWLDEASADALTFAARRLEAEGVAMLFAARDDAARVFRATGIAELELGALGHESVAALIVQETGGRVSPEVAAELAAATGGNPLALVDLAQRLTPEQFSGTDPLPHPLPIGGSLETTFARQLTQLSETAKRALVIAATADTRAMRVISRADAATRAAFEECEDAGLLAIADGQVGFSHPLLRSSVYQRASAAERRDAHRALADAFASDERYAERRAWHAAAAIVEPDEHVAVQLEAAAQAARTRRGHVSAAAMFERAARVTPDPAPRARRLHLAARSAWLAGQAERALRLLDDAVGGDDLVRADAAHLRAQIALGSGAAASDELTAEAARIEAADPGRAAGMLATASESAPTNVRVELARRAVALAGGLGEAGDLRASLALARALVAAGEPAEAQETLARAKTMLKGDLRSDPELILAVVDAVAAADPADAASAAELLELATASARSHALGVLPRALLHSAWLQFAGGRWTDALLHFAESARLADETGRPRERVAAVAGRGLLDALQGRDEDARAAAEHLPAGAADRILGLVELGRGRGDAAAVHLARAVLEPQPALLLRGLPAPALDLTEAQLRAGRQDEAAAAAASIRHDEASAGWASALLAEPEAFEGAAGLVEDRPFLLARVRLNRGEALRRAGSRRDARVELHAALDLFEGLGAEPWAERARQEIRASGATVRRREPNALDELTPQELQVARAVATEATYKDAAAKLFLSPKTVEYHLRKVYRKLGITSGRQLAQRLAEEHPGEGP